MTRLTRKDLIKWIDDRIVETEGSEKYAKKQKNYGLAAQEFRTDLVYLRSIKKFLEAP